MKQAGNESESANKNRDTVRTCPECGSVLQNGVCPLCGPCRT